MIGKRRSKLRYAHQGGKNPPRIIIHGNKVEDLPASYKRYLINHFIKRLKLQGTPLHLEFKSGDNPYKDKPRQKPEENEHNARRAHIVKRRISEEKKKRKKR
jgi:GTP-binding protein